MLRWWRDLLVSAVARVRRGGRASLQWSLRVTIAATLSYVVGTLIFPGTQPLLAPLTAMVVLQVTPVSLLASGLDRVVAVVAGVSLAVGFATVVPLEWWSLGLLILVAITAGQFLRLRGNLIEVAISAMLVLGVGALGAQAAAWQRIAETLVGAAVGILANLVFPPKVASSDAGDAVNGLADSAGELLTGVAGDLDELAAGEDRDRLRTQSRIWLDDVRRITRDVAQVDAALQRFEEGRRLNVRAVGTRHVEPGLRQGLEALEHTTLAVRTLLRAVADASDGDWLEEDEGAAVLTELAQTFRQMAAGIDAFGQVVRNEADVQSQLTGDDVTRLGEALAGLHEALTRLDESIAAGPAREVLELHAVERATVRRLLGELDLEARVRRQLRSRPPRRVHRPRGRRNGQRADLWAPAGPEDETQPIRMPEDDER